MKTLKRIICALLICAVLLALPVWAEEDDASLTVVYRNGEKTFEGKTVSIRRVADFTADGSFTLCGDFAKYPISLNGINSQHQWKSVTATLTAYVASDGIAPDYTAVTDENGEVFFDGIPHGMYLVSKVAVEDGDDSYYFEDFLSAVPRPTEDHGREYDVKAVPKYALLPKKEYTEYKVIKLWQGSGNRPDSVEVEILQDGVSRYTAELSAENNWSFCWSAEDDASLWTAVERNVPDGYTVTVIKDGATFVITNTGSSAHEPVPPQTGDESHLDFYVGLFGLSGSAFILLALYFVRLERRRGER